MCNEQPSLDSEVLFFLEQGFGHLPSISTTQLFADIEGFNIIDVRSEAEFQDSHVPRAINFPILNNAERHEVGWTYKKRSRQQAFYLAFEFAKPKTADFCNLAASLSTNQKPLLIYCFRGGGRSAYSARLLLDHGFLVYQLLGGHKAYRNMVYQALYIDTFPEVLVLKGLTGTGKTELLNLLSPKLRCLDLEFYARNSASSFGRIPFLRQGNFQPISQKYFEDQVYAAAFLCDSPIAKSGILVESESRRVGNVHLPPQLFTKMLAAPTVELTCRMESRVQRIYRDYIGSAKEGLSFFVQDLQNLKKYVSATVFAEYQRLLFQERLEELIELLLMNYYDKKYSGIYKHALRLIHTDNIHQAADELADYLLSGN